jgi:phenylacetate-CoA ligase
LPTSPNLRRHEPSLMPGGIRRHYEALDYAELARQYPPPPEYYESAYYDEPEVVQRRQLVRLKDKVWRTYSVPFHRRRWDDAGVTPDDLQSLDDLWRFPVYTVDDIRRSIDAHSFDESLQHWLNCVVVTTSTGNVTSTEKQVELAIQYGATAILTTGDYLLRLVEAARALGYDPKSDLKIRALPNIGSDAALKAAFGMEPLRSYGMHEVFWVATECPARDGLHIYEDGFIVQIVDPDTGEALPDGELGSVCLTETFKTGSSQFRYSTMDLSYLYPPGRCSCGSWLRRMGPFAGRGDNMVKLRGINLWPEGIAEIACSVEGVEPDYFVRVFRRDNRDELVIALVSPRSPETFASLAGAVERRLQQQFGIKIGVSFVSPGSLDADTEIHTSPKPKRFRDERP